MAYEAIATRNTNLNQGPNGSTNPPDVQLGTFSTAEAAIAAMKKDGVEVKAEAKAKDWSAVDESSANFPKMPEGYTLQSVKRMTKEQVDADPFADERFTVKAIVRGPRSVEAGYSTTSSLDAVTKALAKAQPAEERMGGTAPTSTATTPEITRLRQVADMFGDSEGMKNTGARS